MSKALHHRVLLGLAATFALLSMGCIKKTDGSSGGTALYLFDGASSNVVVWKNMETLYDATTVPAPDLTLASASFARGTVATGGLVLDTQRNRLYLVYQDGVVIRVDQLRSQSGAVVASNVIQFTLDSAHRLTGSVFGQAALDAQSDTLYAVETGTSGSSQVWAVSQPDTLTNSGVAPFVTITDDESGSAGAGVAAGQSAAYAYFANGNQVIGPTGTPYNGQRLRKGTASAFNTTGALIGDQTGLDSSTTGTLALDTANSTLFVGLDAGTTGTGSATVLAFKSGQFGFALDQAPNFVLGDASTGSIKVLAHPGSTAWLVGLPGGAGTQNVLVWKQPASGVASKTLALGDATAQYLGAALDGTGS